jgi:ABC-2 type transport system ATP-binding protein
LQDAVTPREALRLFASFYRDAARPGDLLRQFGLEEKADSRFGTLSAGQRQRLFLALAFVSQPRVVVLDEPTAGLDPKAQRELHQLITMQRDAGRTILLSTHDLEEADKLCDRLAIVDCGRIVVVDRPAHLIAASGLAARLLFQTVRPLAARQVEALAGIVTCESHGTGWTVETNDLSATVQALTRLVESENNGLLDLQMHQPSLEEVYLELTGHAWPGNEDGGTGR